MRETRRMYILGGQIIDVAGGRVELIRERENVCDTNTGVEIWRDGCQSDDKQLEVLAEV